MPYHLPSPKDTTPILTWLMASLFMVLVMVTIGGVTRLTGSGLSMTGWKPITGWLPPLSLEAWQAMFAAYQQSPEYRYINAGMSLKEFQGIFWLEYIHRLMGRITGLVFMLPLIFFIFKGALPKGLIGRLSALLVLGGFQGIVGWLMVKSGLSEEPRVSPYMLAFHLGMASVIFLLLLHVILQLYHHNVRSFVVHPLSTNLQRAVFAFPVVIWIQMMIGAFVAGLDAGLIYNSFPDMNGHFLPDGPMAMQPWYHNLFENPGLVQFIHRMMAYVVTVYSVVVAVMLWRSSRAFRPMAIGLLLLLAIQFSLGVLTLLYQVPLVLASLHQVVAFMLLGWGWWMAFYTLAIHVGGRRA